MKTKTKDKNIMEDQAKKTDIVLPFGLPPAPEVEVDYTPVDLGKYNKKYTGWFVIFDSEINAGRPAETRCNAAENA